jgi:polar amino acid transport system substrate-binding protein
MKKLYSLVLWLFIAVISGCNESEAPRSAITFGVCADYPPFEYRSNNKLMGFDIELARLIAHELNREVAFQDMQFSSILVALQHGSIDAAISTITITDERKKNFDLSDSYYEESLSVVYKKTGPMHTAEAMKGKKIACQLGTTMEIWLKNHATGTVIILMDNNNQAIEALKAGHVDGVFIDKVQASVFSSKNPELAYSHIATSDTGYGIAVKKNSALTDEINQTLYTLKNNGELEKLKQKYLENIEWSN